MGRSAKNSAQKARDLSARIRADVKAAAGKGLTAAAYFLLARSKEAMSVPAPRKRTASGYRATTRATPGAPIRKLSGRARAGMYVRLLSPVRAVIGTDARSIRGFGYPQYHEQRLPNQSGSGKHPWVRTTAAKYRPEISAILGLPIRTGR